MKSQDEISDEAIGYASHNDPKGNVNPEGYSEKQVGLLHGFIDGYQKCQEDNADKKYTEEDLRKAISQAKESYIGYPIHNSFEDSEIIFLNTADEIIEPLNKK